jgi:hypothetical protein
MRDGHPRVVLARALDAPRRAGDGPSPPFFQLFQWLVNRSIITLTKQVLHAQ